MATDMNTDAVIKSLKEAEAEARRTHDPKLEHDGLYTYTCPNCSIIYRIRDTITNIVRLKP